MQPYGLEEVQSTIVLEFFPVRPGWTGQVAPTSLVPEPAHVSSHCCLGVNLIGIFSTVLAHVHHLVPDFFLLEFLLCTSWPLPEQSCQPRGGQDNCTYRR